MQVTGIRQDAWAKANPQTVGEEKVMGVKGLYIHPEAFNQPKEKALTTLFYK